MKIAYIVPGFGGSFYCENCTGNMNIVTSLEAAGHQVIIVNMYLPINRNMTLTNSSPIFYGAVSVYLKEKFPFFQKMPGFIRRMLDTKAFLKFISRFGNTASPKGLEKLTISVMKGPSGGQKRELERLADWLKRDIQPDVVHLSNALLVGLARGIKARINIPVFCTLQDENSWIDEMANSYAKIAWNIFKEESKYVDAFISVSYYYRSFINKKINIPLDKIEVVYPGIETKKYKALSPCFHPLTIGYLSRMSELLGLDILIDAFIILKKNSSFKDLRLKLSGGYSKEDKKFLKKTERKIKKLGLMESVDFVPDQFNNINNFLESLTLLCVPIPEGEAFGLFQIEAMASGIPVVQPACGAFPEIIEDTGGGVLFQPNTPGKLAEVLMELLARPEELKKLGTKGKNAVLKRYNIENTRDRLIKIYKKAGKKK